MNGTVFDLAPPYVVVEVAPLDAVRAWESVYTFDTTNGGLLDPLPLFHFELKDESSNGRTKHERPFRLYCNGSPCVGRQWQYSVEGAYAAVDHFIASYAYHRRASIHTYEQTAQFAKMRNEAGQ